MLPIFFYLARQTKQSDIQSELYLISNYTKRFKVRFIFWLWIPNYQKRFIPKRPFSNFCFLNIQHLAVVNNWTQMKHTFPLETLACLKIPRILNTSHLFVFLKQPSRLWVLKQTYSRLWERFFTLKSRIV